MKIFCITKPMVKLFLVLVLFCSLVLNFNPFISTQAQGISPPLPSAVDEPVKDSCSPSIIFTSKPPYGSLVERTLYGRVDCVNPADYKVAVYIYVTGWWTKPNWDHPLTPIASDGSWSTNVVTGGLDHLAIQYAAFLVPNGYNPPLMGGNAPLPQELFDNSVAHVIEDRLRTIEFSGYTWNVKASEAMVGPGDNYFSAGEDDVWVDTNGYLHLTITFKNNKWYSTEVFSQAPFGYGTYTFTLASPVDQLDKNAVLGLFTWDDSAPEYYYRENDIEFSRWGQDLAENSQFVVQPFDQPGHRHRFDTTLTGTYSTHGFTWDTGKVSFFSYQGYKPNLGAEIETWQYAGADVPPAAGGNVRINLWLYNHVPPSDGLNIEVVIKSFEFEPLPTIFTDVPATYWAWTYIERLYKAGITGGCGTSPLIYCPESDVTRAQMAVFLEKGIHYPTAFTPPNVSPTFTDTVGHWAEDWIETLRSDGITGGCGPDLYCPDAPVTRAQMAVFLLKSKYGSGYTPPAVGSSTGFNDVPVAHWAAAWIKQLAVEGITGGCGSGNYCPEDPATRAQMAVFLVRTFNLPQ